MTVRSSGLAAFAALIAALGVANAADAPSTPAAASDWAFAVHAYTWATSVGGDSRTLPPGDAVKIHLGFADILKHLDGALMVSTDARRGRLVLFSDVLLSKLSAGKAFTARGHASSVSLASSSAVGLASAGWRVVDDPTLTLDLLGGVRGFALSNTIALTVGPAGGSHAVDRQWVDAVGGVRASWAFADRWTLTGMGFGGGGGAGRSTNGICSAASATAPATATSPSPAIGCSGSTIARAATSGTRCNTARSSECA